MAAIDKICKVLEAESTGSKVSTEVLSGRSVTVEVGAFGSRVTIGPTVAESGFTKEKVM